MENFQGKQIWWSTICKLRSSTRSGKGVGIIIPNLLDWQDSAVVQDIKQECFDYTSRYRKEKLGQEVYLFNPLTEEHIDTIHCIILIWMELMDGELIDLANILYPISSSNENSVFFNQLAQSLYRLSVICVTICLAQKGLAFLKGNNLWCNLTLQVS